MHAPTNVHLLIAKRILCYLKRNISINLLYNKQKNMSIEGYADVD